MPIFSSGPRGYTTTIRGDSGAVMLPDLQAFLTTKGWTVVSGGGTSTVLFKSGVTAEGKSICCRVRDPGAGGGAFFRIQDEPGVLLGNEYSIAAVASLLYVCVAGPHCFHIFSPGTPVALGGRVFSCGTLSIPSFFSPITAVLGWSIGPSNYSYNCNLRSHWSASDYVSAGIFNNTVVNLQGTGEGQVTLIVPWPATYQNWRLKSTWWGNVFDEYDPIMGWGDVLNGDPTKRGLLYDHVILSDKGQMPPDTTQTWNGHDWYPVTYNANSFPWVLWAAVS